MGRYDNENVIISEARSVPAEKTCFLTKSPFERQLYRAVIKEWPKWTINNGHDNIPPDYFSCDHKLMFDVMRINDSESVITTKRGKDLLYNPVKAKERSMLHEVQSFAKELSLNISTDNIFVNGEPDGNYDAIHIYMTEFLHPELNKRFRKVINSSPIFQEGELRGNFNLLCAAMDRIDTCVAYLNKHSNFPRTEEDFIIFLMFAAMLRDAVLDVLVGVLPNFERNSGELHFFKDTYFHSAVYNPDRPVPSDDRFFEYIRTLAFAHPTDTSRPTFLRKDEKQYSPWVIVNRTLNRFMGTPNMVGIRVYTTASDEIINIQFPLQVLKDYISSRYEKLSLAISWAEESIRKAEAEWREHHIKRNVSPVEVLTSIKEVLALRYQSTGEIDDMIRDLTCPLTIQENLKSVSEYRNAIIDAIPQICDGIENLEELFNIPVYNALRELPKTMPQGTYYQLEKIFTYLDDAYSTGENYAFGLVQAGDFAESFAKKWVVICPQEMPICEILLLVRTACYLEAQAQKRRQPL